jgi:heterodisulfide reductase subunit A-like polyferredoxin
VRDEHTQSLWMDIQAVEAPRLSKSERTDVVVVGSGIAGLSVAYELVSRGRSVIVLDRGRIGSGMTARTTAIWPRRWTTITRSSYACAARNVLGFITRAS